MNFRSSDTRYTLLTFCVAFALLTFFYHEVLFDPNNYLFAPTGDGIQNYYTYLFQARYGSDFWNFSGMNYPFGEHVVYAGSQPLLAWLISIFGLEAYGIGILNFLILISLPVCAVFLFKIFRHYELPWGLSLISAVVIAFMSPQVLRMTGHLTLTPVFVIPLMWWLLICCNRSKHIGWSLLIAGYILWCFFTHPYLGLIVLLFGFVFWLVNLIADRSTWKIMLKNMALQVILPFAVFQGLIMITDTHVDRVGTPGGFFYYYANWKSIFIAHHGPLSPIKEIFEINIGNWESWNYVGCTTAVFAIFIMTHLVVNRKNITIKTLRKNELVLFFITAYLILLFSFCFPLKYQFLRGIVDYFGPLKQFRVLGRFSWVFFYVFTVCCIILFYRLMKQKNSVGMRVIFYGGLLFYVFEFYPVHQEMSETMKLAPNSFKKESLSEDLSDLSDFIEREQYDAFVFLPFNHLSSENLFLLGTDQASYESFMISYHTGRPMMNALASRMSLSETILVNNFFSPEFVEKELVYHFPQEDRILVIKNMEPLKPHELRLLWCSDLVYENTSYKAFEFDAETWNNSRYFDDVVRREKEAVYDVGSGWRSDTNKVWFYHESFDDQPGENFTGGGALHGIKQGYNVFLELTPDQLDTGFYKVSFWYYFGIDRPDVEVIAEQVFTNGKKANWYDKFHIRQSTFTVDDWCYVELDFEFTTDMEKITLMLTGSDSQEPFYIDEVLVQKQSDHPLFSRNNRKGKEYIIYDNHWLRSDSFQRK